MNDKTGREEQATKNAANKTSDLFAETHAKAAPITIPGSCPTQTSENESAVETSGSFFDRMLKQRESVQSTAPAAVTQVQADAGQNAAQVVAGVRNTYQTGAFNNEAVVEDVVGTAHEDEVEGIGRKTGESEQHPEASRYGRLHPEARRALAVLLKQGVLMGAQKRLLYDALCRHEAPIRDHLADMFLDLTLDTRAELALIVQQQGTDNYSDSDNEDDSFVKLIQRRPLTLYDSMLLIVLRKFYQQRETSGESRVLIEREQIAALLTPFLPLSNNNALQQRKLNGALDKLEKHKIVVRLRGDAERLEISPVIRYVVDPAFLAQLEQEYKTLTDENGQGASSSQPEPGLKP